MNNETAIALLGAALALVSAGFWFAAATKVVTREQEVANRLKQAEKDGTTANLAGVSMDGIDPMATMRLQSKLNALGAAFAGAAILAQAIFSLIS